MSSPDADPIAQGKIWDVVVVGTGMGGATVGYELARSGHEVLFIEKGPFVHAGLEAGPSSLRDAEWLPDCSAVRSDTSCRSKPNAWWPHQAKLISNRGKMMFPLPVGCGTGGSTAFYAAGLERFSPADFAPRANFPDDFCSSLPEHWPIDYQDLQPYYDQAEVLFRVRGTQDPLFTGGESTLAEPWPLGGDDATLARLLSDKGLHPYRVHAGFESVSGCTGCPAGHCPSACKSDAAWVCLVPALLNHGARIIADCTVTRLEANKNRVTGVYCRRGSDAFVIRGGVVILAAGAFSTPALLLSSNCDEWPAGLANSSGLVGRNLMFHGGDFFAIRAPYKTTPEGPRKTLALNDLYFSKGRKLGTFQMLGVNLTVGDVMQFLRDSSASNPAWWAFLTRPNPIWLRKLVSPLLRLAVTAYCRLYNLDGVPIWASIIEDLPYPHNRVSPDPEAPEQVVIEYQFSTDLMRRSEEFRSRLRDYLGGRGFVRLSRDVKIDYAHASGTCRFGDDPKTSVLDRNNRAHGVENLYVVDASFFPSSAGTNPSLTIAANAIRVAEKIHHVLSGDTRDPMRYRDYS